MFKAASPTKANGNPLVTELLLRIAAADVIKVDDKIYGFKTKPIDDWMYVHQLDYTRKKIEDYEAIFETDLHLFNWWEVREESSKVNDKEWKIGNHTVSFYTIEPI